MGMCQSFLDSVINLLRCRNVFNIFIFMLALIINYYDAQYVWSTLLDVGGIANLGTHFKVVNGASTLAGRGEGGGVVQIVSEHISLRYEDRFRTRAMP